MTELNSRVICFFAFFGTEEDSDDIIRSRFNYINQQLDYLARLCDDENITLRFISATLPNRFSVNLIEIATRHGFYIYSRFVTNKNNFENNGISACLDFAKKHPESLIYYCHSKGAVNYSRRSMGIFKYHCMNDLQYDLNEFSENKMLFKAGLFPSRNGWLWHNFFWAKATYLNTKILTPDGSRHYYESFMGENKIIDGYLGVLSTIPESIFTSQDDLKKNLFYEANEINKCGFLNKEFHRLGGD